MTARLRTSHVFINCPFDPGYRPVFDVIVFAVNRPGFVARCSVEEDDGAEFRLSRIERIIEECRFGINDLSAVTLDTVTGLPRFSGQDIRAHGGDPERAIREVRDWFRLTSKRTTLPGGAEIVQRYRSFRRDLPDLCSTLGLEPGRLTFLDLFSMIMDWLRTDR